MKRPLTTCPEPKIYALGQARPAVRSAWVPSLLLSSLLLACGKNQASPSPSDIATPADSAPPLQYRSVISERLATLCVPPVQAPTDGAMSMEQVEPLLRSWMGSNARFAKVALQDLTQLREQTAHALSAIALDESTPYADDMELRVQAVRALGLDPDHSIPSLIAVGTVHLSKDLKALPLRRQALYQLGLLKDPRALLPLLWSTKYETDPESFLWLGWALLQFGNGTGVPALYDLTRSENQDLAGRAHAILDEAASQRGCAIDQLWATWLAADDQVWPAPVPSQELECAVWQAIEKVSGAYFQLRGVDDARAKLSGLGSWAAPYLASALSESDHYVRLHCAQVLQRMGRRAKPATEALIEALADPQSGPTAAAALGAIGKRNPGLPADTSPRQQSLIAALELACADGAARPLRIAALKALALCGSPQSAAMARSIFEATPAADSEIRNASAAVSLWVESDAVAFDHMVEELVGPSGHFPMSTLVEWVRVPGRANSPESLKRFETIVAGSTGIPSLEAIKKQRQQLHDWCKEQRSALLAQ